MEWEKQKKRPFAYAHVLALTLICPSNFDKVGEAGNY